MSNFKAGDRVIRVRNGEHMGCKQGDIAVVEHFNSPTGSFTIKGHDGSFDPDSFELCKSSDLLFDSVTKAKELQDKINVLQKELDQHLSVMKEYGIQFIEGATDVA